MHIAFLLAVDGAYVAACLLIVDLISGVLHWAEDTWTAPGRSALLDRWIVRDNIEHHRMPGSIRAGTYWETNRVGIALSVGAAAILVILHVHAWQAYLICVLASHSNQVHLWAHCSRPPAVVAILQSVGVLQSRRHHSVHHKRPYAVRFCAMTDLLNPILDGIRFWRTLEWLLERCGATLYRASAARNGY